MMLSLVAFASFFAVALSQIPPMYLGSGMPFDNYFMSNVIDTKPVMSYLPDYPMYADGPDFWTSQNALQSQQPQFEKCRCEVGNVASLQSDLEHLHRQTKEIFAERMRHAEEMNRLREEMRVILQSTNHLRSGLRTHEEELLKLWRTMASGRDATVNSGNQEVVKDLIAVLEKLEVFVESVVNGFKEIRNKMDGAGGEAVVTETAVQAESAVEEITV